MEAFLTELYSAGRHETSEFVVSGCKTCSVTLKEVNKCMLKIFDIKRILIGVWAATIRKVDVTLFLRYL